jgi:hypothetical protein
MPLERNADGALVDTGTGAYPNKTDVAPNSDEPVEPEPAKPAKATRKSRK